ncbi:tRNA (adenosine(37)-N6)-dimethylallyltransferase MiaA [Paramicrobacterium sp. CJ85]|uniref:tRNA (adenosine(37)-N6)-dimethylallyltransferase MiaA n=1 Tax=Paramicrobacterium sp. CJ85 TaxID=3445355 RepID=UPI003F5ED360
MIVGPTGTGKSDLSLALAERFHAEGRPAEIINCDAMQLYRGMDIGTAKLAPSERRGVTHHLLDVLDVTEEASVADFQRHARAIVDSCRESGIVPIMVGGSGLYASSVIYPFEFPGTSAEIRARLESEVRDQGIGMLAQRLASLDAEVAARVGTTNARRIIRALEVAELTGDPASGMLPEDPPFVYPTRLIGLTMPREVLLPRLDERVHRMWERGLVHEVEALREKGIEKSATASRAIGYAQAGAQLDGRVSQDEAIAETQSLTRRYSRRQVSWFKRYVGTTWLDARSDDVASLAFAAAAEPLPDL